jgi:hypothetical protein
MFQFSGLARYGYVFTVTYIDITLYGLSHSEIRGSQAASAYSRLIAGNHVLHRLLVPRHPPCALGNFIIKPMIQWGLCSSQSVRPLFSRCCDSHRNLLFLWMIAHPRCITTVFDDRRTSPHDRSCLTLDRRGRNGSVRSDTIYTNDCHSLRISQLQIFFRRLTTSKP